MHVAVESEKCQEQACFRIPSYFLPCLKGTDRPLWANNRFVVIVHRTVFFNLQIPMQFAQNTWTAEKKALKRLTLKWNSNDMHVKYTAYSVIGLKSDDSA